MELKHSEVRRIVLNEHADLRRELADISASLVKLEQERPGAAEALARQWRHFARIFLDHLEHEEEVLRPVLVDIDAWSKTRIEHMDTDHVQQRARVAELLETLSQNPLGAADDLRAFLGELAVDMEEEERLNLGEELMRDEVLPYSSGFSG
jgi:iron-sulfur cluster repair protein YtfE (RIC family)